MGVRKVRGDADGLARLRQRAFDVPFRRPDPSQIVPRLRGIRVNRKGLFKRRPSCIETAEPEHHISEVRPSPGIRRVEIDRPPQNRGGLFSPPDSGQSDGVVPQGNPVFGITLQRLLIPLDGLSFPVVVPIGLSQLKVETSDLRLLPLNQLAQAGKAGCEVRLLVDLSRRRVQCVSAGPGWIVRNHLAAVELVPGF